MLSLRMVTGKLGIGCSSLKSKKNCFFSFYRCKGQIIERPFVFPFPLILFLSLMADVQYPAPAVGNGGQGPQPVARSVAHAEIPPPAGQ